MDPTADIKVLRNKAADISAILRLLANEKRLLVLHHLALSGEMSVTALGFAVGLRQPAISQHLARLRAGGVVKARREAQILHYRIADPRVGRLLAILREIQREGSRSERGSDAG